MAYLRTIGRFFEISHVSVLKLIRRVASQVKRYIPLHAEDIEIDELYLYIGKKKKKRWLWTAICRKTKRILAFQLGSRSRATVRKLYEKIKAIQCNKYHTDSYKGYLTVFPEQKHSRRFRGTNTIEGINSATRHYLARFRRRSKCYSKSESMVNASMILLTEKYSQQYEGKIQLQQAA